jgi:aminoglycoside 6'-N-acetyltransferase I
MKIVPLSPLLFDAWVKMRCELWPEYPEVDLRGGAGAMLLLPAKNDIRIASVDGKPIGFAETSLRSDYVNGCETSPVAFLEGIYVAPDQRRKGVARALIGEAEAWAKKIGCKEFASDALLANSDSHKMHTALGFSETERVVYFRKSL